ncbi:MAG: MFS transporter [Anaerolineae bacterium]|nr:MFS transporter [Anaerolineae bacterium]
MLRFKLDARRVYILLSGGTALFFSIAYSLNLVYQVEIIGLDPLQLVLVGTTLEAAAFLFEIPTGIVADVYSRKWSILIGYALIGCGQLIEGLIPTFAAVLVAQVVWGVGYTFTSGATQAWIADEVGEAQVGNVFVRGAQAGQIGGIIGLIISTALATLQLNLPLVIGGVGMLVVTVLMIFIMPETGFQRRPRHERGSWYTMVSTFREGVGLVRLRPVLITILAVSLITGLYSEGLDRLWQKHVLDNFTLDLFEPVIWFGIIGLVSTFLSLGMQEYVRRRLNLQNPQTPVRALLVIASFMVGGMLVFSLTASFALAIIANLLISMLRSTTGPIFDAWLNQNATTGTRATMFSMSGQLNALGQVAGGPAVGWVGRRYSVRAALTISSLLLATQIPLLTRSLRRQPAPADEVVVDLS